MDELLITISTGQKRTATRWKVETLAWGEMAARCSDPKRGRETMEQYLALSRDAQGDLKDVGGFCCALYKDQRRLKRNVLAMTGVCLDLDFAEDPEATWRGMTEAMPGTAMLAYSTRKHRADAPRLRVVLPLSQNVLPEYYQPIARMAAKTLGIIDMCDCTTFEDARLFYWPSVCRDGEFFFRCQDGKGLSPHEMLGRYADWRDCSQWPMSAHDNQLPRQTEQHASEGLKDPTKKDGLIGAFINAHTPISEAIRELLADVYQPAGNKFTYIGATTSAGLFVIDESHVHSYHSTDPTCGMTLNIFDLVRIHRFGDSKKSMAQMLDFAASDSATKRLLVSSAFADFDTEEEDEVTPTEKKEKKAVSMDWVDRLKTNRKGETEATVDNVRLILENDPRLKDAAKLNLMAGQPYRHSAAPWPQAPGDLWTDADDAGLRDFVERHYGIWSPSKVSDAFKQFCEKRCYHPIAEYLEGLPAWDRIERVPTLFVDYLGADDTPLVRAMTKTMLVGAVARVMRPGVKFDNCLILQGPEGIGKSSVLAALGGKWHSDSLVTTEGKAAMEQIQGKWIIELGELDAMKKSEASQLKNFITSEVDHFRGAYDRYASDHPRQCVFFGTTNEEKFLKGLDGNRRFWVVRTSENAHKDFRDVERERDQIWAEALAYYRDGHPLKLDRHMERQARAVTKEYNADEDRMQTIEDSLRAFLDKDIPTTWEFMTLAQRRSFHRDGRDDSMVCVPRCYFCAQEYVTDVLGIDVTDSRYPAMARDINKAMKRIEGWESVYHVPKLYPYPQVRGYKNPVNLGLASERMYDCDDLGM